MFPTPKSISFLLYIPMYIAEYYHSGEFIEYKLLFINQSRENLIDMVVKYHSDTEWALLLDDWDLRNEYVGENFEEADEEELDKLSDNVYFIEHYYNKIIPIFQSDVIFNKEHESWFYLFPGEIGLYQIKPISQFDKSCTLCDVTCPLSLTNPNHFKAPYYVLSIIDLELARSATTMDYSPESKFYTDKPDDIINWFCYVVIKENLDQFTGDAKKRVKYVKKHHLKDTPENGSSFVEKYGPSIIKEVIQSLNQKLLINDRWEFEINNILYTITPANDFYHSVLQPQPRTRLPTQQTDHRRQLEQWIQHIPTEQQLHQIRQQQQSKKDK